MADTMMYFDGDKKGFTALENALKNLKLHNPVKSASEDPEKLAEFGTRFEYVYNMIIPLVDFVNKNYEGAKLFLFRDERSPRKFIQITLSPDQGLPNILQDPSLFIEGYPKMGQVRITQSKASEEGDVVNVNDITPQYLESYMVDFLDTAVSSLK